MANKGDLTTTAHGYFDLNTGKHVDEKGNEIEVGGLDPETAAQLAKLAGPRTATLVGNEADKQVQGAELAASGDDNGHESGSAEVVVKTDPQAKPLVDPVVLEPGEDAEIGADAIKAAVAETSKEDTKDSKKSGK